MADKEGFASRAISHLHQQIQEQETISKKRYFASGYLEKEL